MLFPHPSLSWIIEPLSSPLLSPNRRETVNTEMRESAEPTCFCSLRTDFFFLMDNTTQFEFFKRISTSKLITRKTGTEFPHCEVHSVVE